MLHFLFPADGLEPRKVDEVFRPQADALAARGFAVSLVPDEVFRGERGLRSLGNGDLAVYRGWMVRPSEYSRFDAAVRAVGSTPISDAAAYELTHWLPRWYPLLREWTAETVTLPADADLVEELARIGWERFFLKDFVKSLKTRGGSVACNPADGARWLREFLDWRDDIEGGICVRRVEQFIPESETRFFVLDGVPHAPAGQSTPFPVLEAATRVDSRFFTVDVARNDDGDWRVVELGDGQVSDLVGWTPERFAEIWA